ncbi:hypothetical protein BHM03_00057210, partial [Ensete ventricosum]
TAEGQRDTKNATLIPSARTLSDYKLRVDLYRGSTSWNSIGVSSFKVFYTMVEKNLIY